MALSGAKQYVVCLNDVVDPALLARLKSANVEVLIVGKRRLCTGLGLIMIWRLIQSRSFDVSITFLFAADIIGTIFAWMAGIPTRISAQRASNKHYSLMRCIFLKVVLHLTTTIVLNSKAYRTYSARFSPRNIQICIIPNGIDTDRYNVAPKTLALHQELMLRSNSLLIGCVGRLAQQKSLDTVIKAVAHLGNTNITVLIIGTGPKYSFLNDLADTLDLSSQIKFLGQRTDIDQILINLDIFIQASTFEGMPNSLMEAMAAGCPVIATGADENRELIGKDEYGWLFQSGNAVDLAKVVDKVLENAQEASRRAVLARDHIRIKYPEQKMLNSWATILK
jgi:glycosyltransferase involved in cell wall biosynthesis